MLCISLVMIVMANASLNVALPTLAATSTPASSSLQWIVDAYSLVFAGLLLTAGSLGDRYGRRLALNGGLVVFGAASLFAVLSSSSRRGDRRARGDGRRGRVRDAGDAVDPGARVPARRASRAIAIWAGFAGVGVAMGGIVSGALLEHFWWGSIFLINVVVVVVALVAGFFLIPRSREKIHAPLDPLGARAVDRGAERAGLRDHRGARQRLGVDADDRDLRRRRSSCSSAFVAWELQAEEPMLDLRFFRNPRFTAATTAITLVFFAMFGSYFLFTQYLQFVHGYDPLRRGVRIAAVGARLHGLGHAVGEARRALRSAARRELRARSSPAAASRSWRRRAASTPSYWRFALGLVVQALGMGITTAPSTGAIMRSLPLHKAGVGSAVNDTTRELGGALGVAVIGSLVASHFRSSIQHRRAACRSRRRTRSPARCSTPRPSAARGWRDRGRGARTRSSTRSTRRCGSRWPWSWSRRASSRGSCARRRPAASR